MPQQLIAYVQHAFGRETLPATAPTPTAINMLQNIFVLLRNQTGHDFSLYKQNTTRRRIERRMAINQIEKLENYIWYLQQSPAELETLFKDLLIGVTNFFRDPEAFETLEQQAIPSLFENKPPNGAIRVWVPGCSTGEEAYSIAILLFEYVDKLKRDFAIQVFATDIDSEAINKARAGIYPENIAADISPERLGQFFTHTDKAYHVKKNIRDMVVFAEQNVIKDPPFSKMDLISCRNLLIYMGAELQKKVLLLFHYALRQNGHLLLGNSESVGEFMDIFSPVNRKWKLYRRKGIVSPRTTITDFPSPPFMKKVTFGPGNQDKWEEPRIKIRELAEQSLLELYTPACAVINEKGKVLYIHGRTGKYLEPASGEASLDILRMAREGLRLELTTAIRKVIAGKETVRHEGLQVKTNGEPQIVNLTVKPVAKPIAMEGLILVIFEDASPEPQAEVIQVGGELTTDKDQRIEKLQQELRTKEEYLQTTIEEMETSNEELKSTNEELQSSYEELQSTNEELETSKEELQSLNEELVTVNVELQKKVDALSQANNDIE